MFETIDYTVMKIDGDYAHLKKCESQNDDTILVAMALLPLEITEGCKVRYENLSYEII